MTNSISTPKPNESDLASEKTMNQNIEEKDLNTITEQTRSDPRWDASSNDPGGTTPKPAPSECGGNTTHCSPKELDSTTALLAALWRSTEHQHFLGLKAPDGGFRNRPVASAAIAGDIATALSDSGIDTYFACAEFKDASSRTASNAAQAWAFWLDIDCGEDKAAANKGYASIDESRLAIDAFCKVTELPAPTHAIASGGGQHCYWAMDRAVDPDVWTASAKRLKDLTAKHGFRADPSRTADIASVLRVPGTVNQKYSPPKPVTLEKATEPVDRDAFLQAIDRAYEAMRAPVTSTIPRTPTPNASSSVAPDLSKVASALMLLDPDCDDETWKLRRLAPLAREAQAHPELAEAIRALAKTWSSGELRKSPSLKWHNPTSPNGQSGEQAFASVWDRFLRSEFAGQPTTLGTVFHDAQLAGWRDQLDTRADSDERLAADRALLEAMYLAVPKDPSAPLEREYLAMLARLFDADRAGYQRVREQLKKLNKAVSWSALDAAVKEYVAQHLHPHTHHGYAKDLLNFLSVDGLAPVQYEDGLYCVDSASSLWVVKKHDSLERLVAERHDGKDHCNRGSDYKAIAGHAMSLAANETFFDTAPVGLACLDGFYRVDGLQVIVEPLTADHRQRVRIDFSPKPMPTPLFDAFLRETFKSDADDEEDQQLRLVQEVAGSIMLGVAHRFQKAILLYDKYGRAGKGTFMDIVKELVPVDFTSAVSPFRWDHDYYLMQLVGKRLNVVGELSEERVLPAAHFKTVIGGDSLTGRFPYGRPVTFKNAAGHVFSSNHMITTKDHSEALFARWIIVEFPNSLLKRGKPQDPHLASRIIEREMAGIAQWALDGAVRVLANGGYSRSIVHDRLMETWRRGNNSVQEFIHEDCELGERLYVRKSEFYRAYTAWCTENGRKAFARSAVKDFLMANLPLGIRLSVLDGYEVFRGVGLKTGVFIPDSFGASFGHRHTPSNH